MATNEENRNNIQIANVFTRLRLDKKELTDEDIDFFKEALPAAYKAKKEQRERWEKGGIIPS